MSKLLLATAEARQVFGVPRDTSSSVDNRELFLGEESFLTDWAVLKQIFVDGEYASITFADARVLDLGAHNGYFAAAAFARGAGHVTSYEPAPDDLQYLLRSASGHVEWSVIPAAIAADAGRGTLALADSWTHTLLTETMPEAETVGVQTVTLAEALASSAADVVKIDIEGTEASVLPSTPAAALAGVREATIEVHPRAAREESVVAYMRSVGLAATHRREMTIRFARS